MNNLKIELDGISELVDTELILKLYETASSIPKPLGKQQDNAYMSGRLEVPKTYRNQVLYLAGNINGESNSEGRFKDLRIDVTIGYYIPFEDSNVLSVLLTNNIGADSTGITEAEAANATIGTALRGNTTITSFDEFGYFSKANNSPANEMFKGCTNLESIDLSNTTSIANLLFCNTALTTLNIPNLQILSGDSQFQLCANLTEVLNLGSITSIPRAMFWHCSLLTNIVLPESCTSIGSSAFAGDSLLLNINLQNVTNLYLECFRSCTGLRGEMDLRNVVSIDQSAFEGANISGILNMPKLQTLNGNYIFRETKISGVECLGKANNLIGTFRDCSNLLYAKIPYECTTLGYDVFLRCNKLTSIKQYTDSIDNWVEGEEPTTVSLSRVTSFGINCFYNCSLLLLTQQDIQNATTIGKSAFLNTLLSGPIDLSNVTSIGQSAFLDTKITSVINVGSIPFACFHGCNELTNIIFRPGITVIGGGALRSTNLSNIILPYGFEEFGTSNSGAVILGSCNNITYMQFPSTTTIINFQDIYRDGNPVTAYCVVLATTPPNTVRNPSNTGGNGRGWSWGRPERSRWYVPDSVVNVYKENEQWSPIADYIFPISQLETDSPVNWLLYQTNKDYGVSLNQ